MDKKHIAMFISSLNKGGSERVMVNLAEYFYKEGSRVTIVTQYKQENEYSISEGIERVLSDITDEELKKSRIRNFYRRFTKLRGIWKEKDPDVILSFIGKNNIMAILTSRFLKIPTVISVRGEPREEYYSSILRLATKTIFRLADGIVLQTSQCLDFFPGTIRKKAIILKNSLNPAFLKAPYKGERDKQIVAVGRVDANKNHEMAIRAFAEIAPRYPEYELVIYGEGELRPQLIQLAGSLGLGERIHLPGAVTDVPNVIYKASIFVLCSYTEGMPNTLLEAMSLGLPVISTDCPSGGPRDLIIHDENGILVPPNNWKKMAENLQKILNDTEYAEKMSENASKVQEKYNPNVVNQEWKDYLDKIMKMK